MNCEDLSFVIPRIRIRLVDGVIQQDNDPNYCILIQLFWQFHLLFPSLEVINSLLRLAAERQPAVWLNSSLQSRPARVDVAPQDMLSRLVNDIHSEKKHTYTYT